MIDCTHCGVQRAAKAIGLCVDCLRASTHDDLIDLHALSRKRYELPLRPPQHGEVSCKFCANECRMAPGELGYCGLRYHEAGRRRTRFPKNQSLAYMYLDPLPTNCCAAWFCEGSHERGYNLAVFFYGCNFDCLYCQNSSHKEIAGAPGISVEELVGAALDPRVRCICYFGGSPEPQLPFALQVSRRIIQESGNRKRICWEWNGCGNPVLVRKAAELSWRSGGTVKFDLKCFHPNLSSALCGVSNRRAFENFSMIAEAGYREVLTATTLLVPFYVDAAEVESIARFISAVDRNIPYSLLVFHPDFFLKDLPITPRKQVEECYRAAKAHLENVNVGNKHLLGLVD